MRSGQARDTVTKGAFLTATLIAKAFSLPILLVCKIIDKSRSLALEFNRQITDKNMGGSAFINLA